MAMELMYKKFLSTASGLYKRSLATELNKIGVRYEDLMISDVPAVKEALELADPAVVHGRYRRLKRASDLDYKKKFLTDYAPDKVGNLDDTFREDLWPDILKIQARDEERILLDTHKM